MKIVDAKVIVCCPGRNFVTLKIATEDGIYGLGDATLNGRELSVASYLTDHVCPLLIGRDARRIEDIWQYFYKGAYWRRGAARSRCRRAPRWTRRCGISRRNR
jgi:mannonate dehydratase